ncbi:mycofactocin system GMC family oxidoreductase MftG [Nocardia sp. NBC_00565]|uniref:mycofactocin dehydrogenase MftG n=1 Tax=Nocardia sp. NBC_00565 TaxID=2975993 RepID=UPI002E822621|nr:mycofactocin system GMC family oxidoreductase MftG [Nocardia sp. NBC_00565]WUC01123.1 mycofactocin system GMC family oxidoreductase MftG [Nocardia sp. NBC_00565]
MVDTLIIGGGTAGCVLAARLSADPSHTVRLLEAGPVWTDAAERPADLLDANRMPIDPESPWLWRYPVTLADGAGVVGNIVRGKVIGGSGAINGGYFVRATAADFTAWSKELDGSTTWSFDSVLPAYRRLERDFDYGDRPGHGTTGPIPVRRTAAPTPLSLEFASACTALGFPLIPDLNTLPGTAPADGFGPVPCNIEHGMRVDTGSAYLMPALARPNLTVTGAMLVTRIRFRGTRAIGVDYLHEGKPGTVDADRIVLCAGAIESAALLLRSGIGDPEQLRALDIPVRHPAPVGAWFSDHPEIGIDYRFDRGMPDSVPLEYVLEIDDVEIRPYAVSFTPYTHRLGVALMRPRSEGVLRLRSADPVVAPHIDYRYLSAAADRIRLREAVTSALAILREIPMAYAPDSIPEPAEGWLRANLATSQHLSGTCRMGGAHDERAVVDEWCRVHGTTGLSVVDLSVVPVPLSRGPQATAMLIAERAAEHLT